MMLHERCAQLWLAAARLAIEQAQVYFKRSPSEVFVTVCMVQPKITEGYRCVNMWTGIKVVQVVERVLC